MGKPLSELTLGEADSFLETLICQTQGSGGRYLIIHNLYNFKYENKNDLEERMSQMKIWLSILLMTTDGFKGC